MKKVLIIFPKDSEAMFNSASSRTFGGATVQMYLIAREMKKNPQLDVYSLICDYEKIHFTENEYFQLVKSYKEEDSLFSKIIKTHKRIMQIKPDVIIQHGLTTESCLMALYCYFNKIKFIFMFAHDIEVTKKFQSSGKRCYLFNMLIRFSSLLVVQNRYQQGVLEEKYKGLMNKVILLYNGFPVKKRVGKKNKNILWVARSDKWKRPDLFIRLASLNPDYQFTMICPNSGDSLYYNKLIELSENVNNLKFIKFVSFNEIDNYFEKAYLFINTSDYEGFPQTFIQAVMNSAPILSLNVDPDGFITRSECGKVLNGDFDLMADELRHIMSDNKTYKKYSENAYEYFFKHHDVKENVSILIKSIRL